MNETSTHFSSNADKITQAIALISTGAVNKVELNGIKVYVVKDIIRIDIKEVK